MISSLEDNGFVPQPNEFVSQTIIDELRANGTSATWEALYANAVAGNAIPPPYFGVDQTDPIKAAAMFDAYRAVMDGTLPRDQLPANLRTHRSNPARRSRELGPDGQRPAVCPDHAS